MGRRSSQAASRRTKHSNLANTASQPDVSHFAREEDSPRKFGHFDNALIDFISSPTSTSDPSRKRRKVSPEDKKGGRISSGGSEYRSDQEELQYIVVAQTEWVHHFEESVLSSFPTPLVKEDILPYISYLEDGTPHILRIIDNDSNDVFADFLPSAETSTDLHLALLVHSESKKGSQTEGKLWTEFGLSLSHENGRPFLRIMFTIKWNTVSSPYHMHQANGKTRALEEVIRRYYYNPNTNASEDWSPQDFYQSVYVPDKADQVSAAIKTPEVEAALFPFQKRALRWLLQREGVDWVDGNVKAALQPYDSSLPNSFIQTIDAMGQVCFVSSLFGLVTLDVAHFVAAEQQLKGGILAEEMGLGKTVEMISLVTLHQRPDDGFRQIYDLYTNEQVRPTKATLIISPPSILQQWISEVNKHAPHLKIKNYQGIKALKNENFEELLDELAESDIVITTYQVLTSEVHFTQLNPEKKLRRDSKYPRPKSPLMMLSWWRCIIDEAQMVESGVSNAAQIARMIPRMNAWCVSGTPVRGNVRDLLGLLVFLRYEPFASVKHVWQSLTSSHKIAFRKLFGSIALRHSKQSVRDELRLPAQRRYVITVPFSPIEEQHYQEHFEIMCRHLRVDQYGAPLVGWEQQDVQDLAENMRYWLIRLRREALNPGVLVRKRQDGQRDGPLRTIDEVLEAMMENIDQSIRENQRALLQGKLVRGQLFENSPRIREAFDIWTSTLTEATEVVEECREQLRLVAEKAANDKMPSRKEKRSKSSVEDGVHESEEGEDEEEIDPSSRVGVYRNRLRVALEVEHMAVFFQANAYFQIKERFEKPETPEFMAMEKLETQGYERAKKLRQEILQEIFRKADKIMSRLSGRASSQDFIQIPEMSVKIPKGGLTSTRIAETLESLATALDEQANTLDEWREAAIQSLLRPLVDEEAAEEITGDEYEQSTKTQDEMVAYITALRTMIADRHDALTGQENALVESEVKTTIQLEVSEGRPNSKIMELLQVRKRLKPSKDLGSLRGIVSELRTKSNSLKAESESGVMRAPIELQVVNTQLNNAQGHLSKQTKVTTALEKEVDFFTNVMNTRLEYYRQLQRVSDMVSLYEGPNDDTILAKMLDNETKMVDEIATAKAKRRYLQHLHGEEQRICVVCSDEFDMGTLTVCGHQFCRECIKLWWNSHRSCPICRKKLRWTDLHEITYKPQQLTIQTEEVRDSQNGSSSSTSIRKSAIYAEFSKTKLAEIMSIELDGPLFTTKVVTLARHLIWLRESDPGAKSVIYSQFQDFLDVLALAFEKFRIGYSSIRQINGIKKFKEDPGVECFLLHAKAHSSGLNLVNASHVFLCEPLLNTALELQAIARVDRIGQTQETNVWLYLVDGTVEESIHQLSVRRRMEHIDARLSSATTRKGKDKQVTAEDIINTRLEEANAMEIEEASRNHLMAQGKGGEIVQQDDLWECLFGGLRQKEDARLERDLSSGRDHSVVERFLRVEAAEGRRDQINGESSGEIVDG